MTATVVVRAQVGLHVVDRRRWLSAPVDRMDGVFNCT
jgi:hypothetical protein